MARHANSSAIVNKYLYVFVHIEECGRLIYEGQPDTYRGAILKGSHEKALWHGAASPSISADVLVLMLRHPMAYSQFLMCKYSIRVQDKDFPRQGTGVKVV